jgi:rare lipoprotein A
MKTCVHPPHPANRWLFWLILLGGLCASVAAHAQLGFTQTGEASFYADRFHGKKTASGVRYDKTALSAAHRELPFGTRIRVQNLDNGKSVVVTVNDRGPWRSHRILDLSRAAATQLDMLQAGTANIKLVVIGDGSSTEPPKEDPVATTEKTPAPVPDKRVDAKPEPKPEPTRKPEPTTKPDPKPQTPATEKPADTKPATKPPVTEKPPQKQPTTTKPEPAATAKPKPFSAPGTWNMYGDKVVPQGWGVQLGAFSSQEKAVAYCEEVKAKGYQRLFIQQIASAGGHTYKVLLGAYDTADLARAAVTEIKAKGLSGFPAQHLDK